MGVLSYVTASSFLLFGAHVALACGLSPHVGPTGAILECDGTQRNQETPWRVAVTGGALRSELSAGGTELGIEQVSLSARGERRLGPRLSIGMGAGSILGGSLRLPTGERANFGVGWTAGTSISVLALAERSIRPFVLATLSAAYSSTQTTLAAGATGDGTYSGRDIRLGFAIGKTIGPLRPYAAARVFGGGFRWTGTSPATTGGDSHLYQVGAGAAVVLPARLDLVVELMPLGERSFTGGAGFSF